MKNTAEVSLSGGGAKPPESGAREENPTSNVKKEKRMRKANSPSAKVHIIFKLDDNNGKEIFI